MDDDSFRGSSGPLFLDASMTRSAALPPVTFEHPDPAGKCPGTPQAAPGRREGQGVALFFTGLSGAGKSTLARHVVAAIETRWRRPVTLLDGDAVREHLSSELGFSREHRDLNIRRIAFVAAEVVRHGGIAVCAAIAPYREARHEARRMIAPHGRFIEVYLATPLAVCEARDPKGLYARARAGVIPCFTGVSDPYEAPERPQIVLDTEALSAPDCCARLLDYLENRGEARG